MQIVLASASPYRKLQLHNFGVRFLSERPLVDEARLKDEGPRDPVALTRFLASRKAASLRENYVGALIIGSDQMAEVDGERLDKPGTVAAACAQLAKLQGREHRLVTSVAVRVNDREALATEVTRIRLRPLTSDEIAAYVALDQPLDCAGSYKIERAGLALIDAVAGDDPGAIQGLPLIRLRRCLAELDVSLTDLWRSHAHS